MVVESSIGIGHLRAALMQSCPERLEISKLADQRELEALKLKWGLHQGVGPHDPNKLPILLQVGQESDHFDVFSGSFFYLSEKWSAFRTKMTMGGKDQN